MRTTNIFYTEGPDGEVVETELPTVWMICHNCNGNGSSSAYLGAFTQSDMEEEGPEFMEDYMDGAYDRPCDCCRGSGKVREVDEARLTSDQRAAWDDQRRDDAADRAMHRAEMAFGC